MKLNDGMASTIQNISSDTQDEAKSRETLESLRRSEARLLEVLQLARLGHWEVDLTSGSYEWSDEIYRIFQRDPREGPMSADEIVRCIHPEDVSRVTAIFKQLMNQGGDHELNCRLVLKNGDVRYLHSPAHGHLDKNGRAIRWSGVMMDVTKKILERMANAMTEKNVLTREVHHRVKNNLQVICSMLAMQAANANDQKVETALLNSYDRVYAMSMIHEMLYGADTSGDIDFEAYARQLLRDLLTSCQVHADRIHSVINIVPLKLSIDRAVPCGLIMNELISNSLKHAFPGERDGEIRISLAPDGAEHYQLVFEDTGVGLPTGFSVKDSRALGIGIVDILVKQLNGTYSLSSSNGMKFRMQFPI